MKNNMSKKNIIINDRDNVETIISNNLTESYENLGFLEKRLFNSLLSIYAINNSKNIIEKIEFLKDDIFVFTYTELLNILKLTSSELSVDDLEKILKGLFKQSVNYTKGYSNSKQTIRVHTSLVWRFSVVTNQNFPKEESTFEIKFDNELFDFIFIHFKDDFLKKLNIIDNKILKEVSIIKKEKVFTDVVIDI